MKPYYKPAMNKKITNLLFTDEELRIMLKWAGKKPIEEITKLVNEVSNVTRNEINVIIKGNKQGLSFVMK